MKFLFIIFLLPLQLFAQDITGVWAGTLYNDTTKQFIKYELAISENKGKFSGYSHTIFLIDGVENIGVKSIKIKKSGEAFLVEDDKLVYNNYAAPPAKRIRMYSELVLSRNDSATILSGPWKTNRTRVYNGLTGNIFLQKKKKINETLIIAKLETLGLAGSLSFMTSQAQPNDLRVINKPGLKTDASRKQDGSIVNNVVSNNGITPNLKVQQTSKQSKAVKQNSKNISPANTHPEVKKETIQQTTKITSEQLLLTVKPKRRNETPSVMSTGNASAKSETQQPAILQKEAKKISDTDLSLATPSGKKDKQEEIKTIAKKYPHAAAEIASREIETIKSVEVKSDSLLLTLYDNGEVDGDTVSVLLNGKVIMPMQGLSTKAINKTIYLTPEMGDSVVLIMYAENLGSIPPNTGLLVVHDGDDTYEIRFSGDLQKNSAIILKKKKLN